VLPDCRPGFAGEWLGQRHKNAGLTKAATSINAAVDATLADPAKHTPDLGGKLGTQAFATAVVEKLG
jgi:3-isopropylmalate dehydrogenase